MSEREIRSVVQRVLEELDRRAKKYVFPSLVGAGIALSGCDSRSVPSDAGADKIVGRADMAYGVPLYGVPMDLRPIDQPRKLDATLSDRMVDQKKVDKKVDQGPMPPYMAPLDGGPQPLYLAPPFDDASSTPKPDK
jgi:hypothetical protein